MIAYVSGKIAEVCEDALVIDVAGLGYKVLVPAQVLGVAVEGQVIKVWTVFYVREDQQSLYGFLSPHDRRLFETLISVSGVGPKVGLKIISGFDAITFATVIVSENLVALTQISGVGKKMAERLVLELKDKVSKWGMMVNGEGATGIGLTSHPDIVLALKALGYHQEEIKKALSIAPDLPPHTPVDEGIKQLLRYLS